MDALSDVLRVSQMTGGVFLHADFFAPWCIETRIPAEHCTPYMGEPAAHLMVFHYVVEGELRIRMLADAGDGAGREYAIGAGSLIILPRNDPHLMGSDLSLSPVLGRNLVQPPEGDGLYTLRCGGDGTRTRMVCGFIGCDDVDGNPVLSALPSAFTFGFEEGDGSEWIRSTFHYAASEVAAGRPGSSTVLAKLSELLFVEAVRRYAETLPEDRTGWLAGLRDPYVARALAALHGDIARPWTVDDLGREVGLSRSALGDRFAKLIGESPMRYLAGWRMQVAAQMLRNSGAPLARIADAVGYDSEAAFSRAFKKAHGVAPASWRRENR